MVTRCVSPANNKDDSPWGWPVIHQGKGERSGLWLLWKKMRKKIVFALSLSFSLCVSLCLSLSPAVNYVLFINYLSHNYWDYLLTLALIWETHTRIYYIQWYPLIDFFIHLSSHFQVNIIAVWMALKLDGLHE